MATPRRRERTDTGGVADGFVARRHQLGLTQAELADLAGVSRSSVQSIESGRGDRATGSRRRRRGRDGMPSGARHPLGCGGGVLMVENLSSVDRADVYKGERLAGSLVREGGDVVFRYGAAYLQDPGAPQVAWTIPTSSAEVRASGGSVPPFFAGLLPEGIRLRGAVAATKTSEDDHLRIVKHFKLGGRAVT